MNVFATSSHADKAARSLDDQRLVKMILESCQLVSTALATVNCRPANFPKPTHAHHPCALWTSEGRDNFLWIFEHACYMDAERQRRFMHNNAHKTLQVLMHDKVWRRAKRLPHGDTLFANCARNLSVGVDFSHVPNTVLAYRLYLNARWKLSPPRFTNTDPPFWYKP